MADPDVTLRIEFEFSGYLNGWTDVSEDVLLANGIQWQRGLSGDTPLHCVAPKGLLTFALDNSDLNSGSPAQSLGYYTEGHANCRHGFAKNVGVRASIVIDSEAFPVFTGRLLKAKPSPGEEGERITQCTVVDYMDQCERKRVLDLPIQVDAADHDIFALIVAAMPVQPRALRIGTGFDILKYVFDTMKSDRATASSEFQRLGQSTLSKTFVEGTGTLVYEPRSIRARNNSINSLTVTPEDLPDDPDALDVDDTRDEVINFVEAKIHPRSPLDAAVVLYALEGAMPLEPNTTVLVRGLYTEPGLRAQRAGGLDMLPASPVTDYLLNTAPDGSGSDVTDDAVIETIFTANSVLFTITTAVTAYLIKLQARGVGVFDNTNTGVEAKDEASINAIGENAFSLDMPYTSDVALGNEVVQYLLGLWRQNTKRVRAMKVMLNGLASNDRAKQFARREISDRIGFEEEMTALPVSVNAGYNINTVAGWVDADGSVWVSWQLGPSDANQYWTLEITGRSELDFTTLLGFSLIVGHTDVAHQDDHDDTVHVDTAHDDTHGDIAHSDAAHVDSSHTDTAHVDTPHQDVAHIDVAHVDGHSDFAHDDSHVDSPHRDEHFDVTLFDPESGFTNHHDSHTDDAHGDGAHFDVPHTDEHTDSGHADTAHTDVNHGDQAHVDTGHADAAHGDTAHDDAHTDTLHGDTAHADDHDDSEHGDQN